MENDKKIFNHIVMGGTFDRLHDGHYLLLKTAGSIANTMSIGLTSSNYLKKYPKKFQEKIFPYAKRLDQLIKYINTNFNNYNFYIFPIDHPSENFSTENPLLDSIIVSEETLSSVKSINKIRMDKNLKLLKAVVISGVISKQSGDYLSSTALRNK